MERFFLFFLLALFVSAQVPVDDESELDIEFQQMLAERASNLFSALDADQSGFIELEELKSQKALAMMNGMSEQELAAFLDLADTDGDQRLSHCELVAALSKGANAVPSFIELAVTRNNGLWGKIKKAGKKVDDSAGRAAKKGLKAAAKGFARGLLGIKKHHRKRHQKRHHQKQVQVPVRVVRQRPVIKRVRADGIVDTSEDRVIPAMTVMTPNPTPFSFMSLLEVSSTADPATIAGASVIASTREATRVQRQMESEKYNEIYRVTDLTLDEVCEQGMPDAFYIYCKYVYAKQADIVDGLRYQYRPADICFRVGMCSPRSYITLGIHSRYLDRMTDKPVLVYRT